MIIPLIVPAIAVCATLCYASLLDIRDRMVRFSTWYPMLAVGIPISLSFYSFFFLHIEESQFPYFCFLVIGIVIAFLAGSILHSLIKHPEIPTRKEIFNEGLMWGVISIPLGTVIFGWFFLDTPQLIYKAVFICIFCVIFYLFASFRLFGGADAAALIFIAVMIPLFPIEPLWGYPPLPSFSFTVLINAVIINLFTPFAIFFYNLKKGNQVHFPYAFLGFPVQADQLQYTFGYIMEEIFEQDNKVKRRFITVREAILAMFRGDRRIYTKDLRLHPEDYTMELDLYKKAGKVWISYGVPFIVPITAGFIIALFVGDILFILMKIIAGV